MPKIDIQQNIVSALQAFKDDSLTEHALTLFKTLGYKTKRQSSLSKKTFEGFKDAYLVGGSSFNQNNALTSEWKYIDLLFQLSKEEITTQHGLFDTKQVDRTIIETYLFFVVELSKDNYSRTALSRITREINKVFPMPVMVIFKHGQTLTLAAINRRLHKRDDQKDVLEKVTLIKDINIKNPHRAHVEILFDLSFEELLRVHKFDNFVNLHKAWQKTLDTKELNKKFYKELSNWYFWAMGEVDFPDDTHKSIRNSLFEKEEKKSERNAKNLIRLLTRLLFVWFVKEKGLIPEEFFDEKFISNELLKNFQPKKGTGASASVTSPYYRAVLQNLFFATLNQTMGKREFRKSGQHMNVTNLMRYQRYFKDPDKFIQLVEKIVPFMNGGLFECLDRPDPEKKGKQGGDVIIYLDGFSDREDNPLNVPDYIFFGTEDHVDLSEAYGDKAKEYKNAAVKGLINILKSYKFTIAENTPLEEEVALDPELLGRVFENLLASYNPETKTTARKQTGSFYTPREIVNYMVDESLLAYLKQKLEDAGIKGKEEGLRNLISYSENLNPFHAQETKLLIAAIDNCKILDPACGSGAFPMGILHKLVHVLHKLDPQNALWKQKQIEKAQTQDDVRIRDQLVSDIEEAFENNELDYGRKLYLIENCIYGVDIQPIATQISKLRFFISLIVDQKVNAKKDNLGIRPLPNLETKFVAANTLIGMNKPEGFLRNLEIDELEEQLKNIRHRLFSAKTPGTKRKLRDEDKILREKMGDLLVESGWENETARQLSVWDPYDQNASSPFFDPAWMFGITDGFDVVIGNPPYLNSKKINKSLREKYSKIYKSILTMDMDLYQLFFSIAIQVTKEKGAISYVTSNSFLTNQSFRLLRNLLLKETKIISIHDFPHRFFPFESVNTETSVVILTKQQQTSLKQKIGICIFDNKKNKISLEVQKTAEIPVFVNDNGFYFNLSELTCKIINSVGKNKIVFDELFQVSNPSSLDRKERYPATTIKKYEQCVFTTADIQKDPELKEITEECITGDKILRYTIHGDKLYTNISWKKNGAVKNINSKTYLMMKMNKLIGQRITGQAKWRIVFTYDDNGLISMPSVNVVTFKKQGDEALLFNLLGVLNSKLYNYLYKNMYRENNTNITSDVFNNIPIPMTAIKSNELEVLIKHILKKGYDEELNNQIDNLIYGFYNVDRADIEYINANFLSKS